MNISATAEAAPPVDKAVQENQLNRAALQAFFGIASDWRLSNEQQRLLLGSPAESTFFKWKKNLHGRLSVDVLDRVSYVMGIHKALMIILGNTKAVERWLNAPNQATLFGGQSAVEFITNTGRQDDLATLRRYVDAQRG